MGCVCVSVWVSMCMRERVRESVEFAGMMSPLVAGKKDDKYYSCTIFFISENEWSFVLTIALDNTTFKSSILKKSLRLSK